jgi:hypothetical protein
MMCKYLGAAALAAMMLSPAVIRADDHDKDHDRDRVKVERYYDTRGHDYHEWNEAEQRAYRHWLEQERHEQYRDWKHANKHDREAYWEWRHAHPDWHE